MTKRYQSAIVLTLACIVAVAAGARAIYVIYSDSSTGMVVTAESLYGLPKAFVYAGQDSAFEDAFPGLDLHVVEDPRQVPPIRYVMAWDPQNERAYDVTWDFNAILADQAAVLATEDAAIRFAEAYAQVSNADLGTPWAIATPFNLAVGLELGARARVQTVPSSL